MTFVKYRMDLKMLEDMDKGLLHPEHGELNLILNFNFKDNSNTIWRKIMNTRFIDQP